MPYTHLSRYQLQFPIPAIIATKKTKRRGDLLTLEKKGFTLLRKDSGKSGEKKNKWGGKMGRAMGEETPEMGQEMGHPEKWVGVGFLKSQPKAAPPNCVGIYLFIPYLLLFIYYFKII